MHERIKSSAGREVVAEPATRRVGFVICVQQAQPSLLTGCVGLILTSITGGSQYPDIHKTYGGPTLVVSPRRFALHPRESLRYPLEQLLHIMPDLGARLDEHHAVLLRLLLALRGGDLPLVVQIGLVADQHNYNIVASLRAEVIHPLPRVLKGPHVRNVVHHHRHAGVTDEGRD